MGRHISNASSEGGRVSTEMSHVEAETVTGTVLQSPERGMESED